jgi:hypothetical protein
MTGLLFGVPTSEVIAAIPAWRNMIVEGCEVRARLVLALKEAKIEPKLLLDVLSNLHDSIMEDIGIAPDVECPQIEWLIAHDAQEPIEKLADMLWEMQVAEMF